MCGRYHFVGPGVAGGVRGSIFGCPPARCGCASPPSPPRRENTSAPTCARSAPRCSMPPMRSRRPSRSHRPTSRIASRHGSTWCTAPEERLSPLRPAEDPGWTAGAPATPAWTWAGSASDLPGPRRRSTASRCWSIRAEDSEAGSIPPRSLRCACWPRWPTLGGRCSTWAAGLADRRATLRENTSVTSQELI